MIKLPAQGKWIQTNFSDRRGSVSKSKNITFDKEGYLQLSHSSRAMMNEATDSDFDEPAAIARCDDYDYFVVTHDQCFEFDADNFLGIRPTQIATAGVPSGDVQSDAVFSGSLLVVTQDTDVDYYDPAANTWTDTDITLTNTSGGQHAAENFLALAACAIADVNTVKLYSSPFDSTPTLLTTLTIPSDFYITGLAYFNQNLYVGTMNRSGGKAVLFVWNGYGSAAQSAYEVDSSIIFDVCQHQDSIALVTGAGQLLKFNGTGFTVLDNLPIFYTTETMADETNVSMFKNCLKSDGDLLYVNISSDGVTNKPLNQPDGIWCYDSTLGFAYHRYSLSGAISVIDTIPTADVNTTTNRITVTTAPITGTEVFYHNGGGTTMTPLVHLRKYFIIKIDGTTIQLATTKANASAGTAIDLTGTGNNAQYLTWFPNTDFGQALNDRVGAIMPVLREVQLPQYGSGIVWGGNVAQRTTSDAGTLGTITSEVENRGYYISPWLTAEGLEDYFTNLTVKFSKMRSELDKILIKYRYQDDRKEFLPLLSGRWAGTWTSTTTFTSTEPDLDTAVVGDEVEILKGGGAGYTAHISTISSNAGTYTITLDEAYDYYESGDTCIFMVRNWRRLGTITSTSVTNGVVDNTVGYKKFEFAKNYSGKQIQFKVELRGLQTRIEEMLINVEPKKAGNK